jgi:hypothetical protein
MRGGVPVAAVALLLGAVAQIAVPLLGVERVGNVADDTANRITPASYAFSIWTPIFILALGWAVWRLVPSARHSWVARRTDHWLAGAFIANAAWEWLFPERQFAVSQVIIIISLVCGAAPFVLLVRNRAALTTVERWLLVPLVALFLGWITAAAHVGFLSTLVALDAVAGDSAANAVIGLVLLAVCLVLTLAFTVYGSYGELQGYLLYVAAVTWAFVAVIIEQSGPSNVTAIGAAIALVALLAVAGRRWLVVRADARPAALSQT